MGEVTNRICQMSFRVGASFLLKSLKPTSLSRVFILISASAYSRRILLYKTLSWRPLAIFRRFRPLCLFGKSTRQRLDNVGSLLTGSFSPGIIWWFNISVDALKKAPLETSNFNCNSPYGILFFIKIVWKSIHRPLESLYFRARTINIIFWCLSVNYQLITFDITQYF